MRTTLFPASDLLGRVSATLRKGGISEPEKEAELIVCHVFNIGRTELYRDDPAVDGSGLQALHSIIRMRLRHEPLQYLTGYTGFYGLRFRVGKGVLIPRPETEMLIEEAVGIINGDEIPSPRIFDVCTGSGCIAIAVAKNLPSSGVIGADISETAIRYARENAELNGVKNVVFRRGDLLEPVRGRRFHLILSNPPYVKGDDLGRLQKEVSEHEPLEALYGGEDGLDFYRRILLKAPDYLEDSGYLILEVGLGQSKAVAEIAGDCSLKIIRIVKDLSGIERVMVLKKV